MTCGRRVTCGRAERRDDTICMIGIITYMRAHASPSDQSHHFNMATEKLDEIHEGFVNELRSLLDELLDESDSSKDLPPAKKKSRGTPGLGGSPSLPAPTEADDSSATTTDSNYSEAAGDSDYSEDAGETYDPFEDCNKLNTKLYGDGSQVSRQKDRTSQ